MNLLARAEDKAVPLGQCPLCPVQGSFSHIDVCIDYVHLHYLSVCVYLPGQPKAAVPSLLLFPHNSLRVLACFFSVCGTAAN